MNCEQTRLELSAWLDDELSSERRQQIDAHLHQCAVCQQTLEELRHVDARFQSLRLPLAAQQRVLEAAESIHVEPTDSDSPFGRRRMIPWVVAALAASIAIAIVSIKPRDPDPIVVGPMATEPAAVARIVRSTGDLEALDPGSEQWQRVAADQPHSLSAGTRLRTLPDVVCEITTSNQSTIRLDASSEIVLHSPEHVQVIDGQIWSRIATNETLRVDTPVPGDRSETESDSLLTMKCPSGSEFQWSVDSDTSVFQSLADDGCELTLLDTFTCPVGGREKVSIRRDLEVQREPTHVQSAKVWQIPLLAMDQSDTELSGMLESLLIQIGGTKAGFMHEQQVRRLGPQGAIPLLAYVQSERSEQNQSARRHAMRIAAETADGSALDRLQVLQSDADPEIAALAKHAIARIRP